MAKYLIGMLLLAVYNSGLASSATPLAAEAAPEAVVDYLHYGLEALGDNENTSIEQRYTQLEPVIRNTYDLPYIGEVMLRRYWRNLSQEDQNLFLQRFERLSILDYASRFKALETNSFRRIEKTTLNEQRVRVVAELVTTERTIEFAYTLQQDSNARWRIIGITADGISEQAIRRSEYTRIMNAEGFSALLKFMEEQIEALASG
ncbi:MAG: ABC transporter substrate-binding protein [Pseudomonadales bacterium]|nr:ABC transporter substrate-binding protein [Pseudomonadales bacterium]